MMVKNLMIKSFITILILLLFIGINSENVKAENCGFTSAKYCYYACTCMTAICTFWSGGLGGCGCAPSLECCCQSRCINAGQAGCNSEPCCNGGSYYCTVNHCCPNGQEWRDGACRQACECTGGTCCDGCNFIPNNQDPGDAYCPSTCRVCNGNGACKNANAGTDVNNECTSSSWSCVGTCERQRSMANCQSGATCMQTDCITGSYVCQGGSEVTASAASNCGVVDSCSDGSCQGTRYYRACDANNCNCRNNNNGAGTAPIYANAGSSLEADCSSNIEQACRSTAECVEAKGNNQYYSYTYPAEFICRGFCDGSGNCDYAGNSQGRYCSNVACGDGGAECGEVCDTGVGCCAANCLSALGTGTLCNSAWACTSNDLADNAYGVGYGYQTQGYCDGFNSVVFSLDF